jgi:hypothetical protein
MTGEGHRAIEVNGYAQSSATRNTEAKIHRRGEPKLHMTPLMRRLSTPLATCRRRADRIADSVDLPPGVILDSACGSGIALAAACLASGRVGLGIEVDDEVAGLAAANINRLLNKGRDPGRRAHRVLVGDGIEAESAMNSYYASLAEAEIDATPPIAMLMLDPARPSDAQNHTLDEMKPELAPLLQAWLPHMSVGQSGPALLLDLSPRLSTSQQVEVDAIIDSLGDNIPRTWVWTSQGNGRIDRLSVWTGPLAEEANRKAILVGRGKTVHTITGQSGAPFQQHRAPMPLPFDTWLTVIDAGLVGAGLHEVWAESALDTAASTVLWMRSSPRRPLLITEQKPELSSEHAPFALVTGRIVHHRLSAPSIENTASIAEAAKRLGVSKIRLRCGLDPDLQPRVQRSLNRRMKGSSGLEGFIVDVPVSRGQSLHSVYILCIEE